MMRVLQTDVVEFRANRVRVAERLRFERETLTRCQARMTEIEAEKSLLVKAVGLIDRTIAVISANGIGRIETTVTSGLQLVFNDPTMSFVVVKNEGARGRGYDLEVKQGDVQGPILETFGGGVANVVAFLLRVIMIKRFKLARVMVADESFNNVSAKILPIVSQLLRSMATDGGFSILAVTHQPILASAADNIYCVVPGDGAPPTLHKLTHAQLQALTDGMDALGE